MGAVRASGRPASGRPLDPAARLADAADKEQEQELRGQLLLQRQRDRFDAQAAERTEIEREYNLLRDMMVEQMKADDEILKKLISMI